MADKFVGPARERMAESHLIDWPDAKLPHWIKGGNESPARVACFASLIDSNTLDQAKAISRMSCVTPFVAVMPDAHLGKGAAVGTVVPTKGAVIPAAVGVDLGCGMIAVKTNFQLEEITGWAEVWAPLEELRDAVERAIPLSAGNYNTSDARFPFTRKRIAVLEKMAGSLHVDFKGIRNSENWPHQLGTLGGGNHFIELSYDVEGFVWLFLHSGSRGVGNALANRRIKQAQELCRTWQVPLEHADLAFLPEGTREFDQYLREVKWAQHFALLNREEMMDRFLAVFRDWFGGVNPVVTERINCHHNYIEREGDLWITRKGAIDAHTGKLGVIPGSMGDKSYVVQGLGNPTGLHSAPHGAGRLYSRSKAKLLFTEDDLRDQMGDIVYRQGPEWIDEAPSCYKPIAQVISDAKTLVKPIAELTQLMNVKGT